MTRSRSANSHPADRFIGRLPGRYVLPNRQAPSGVTAFACRTQSVSTGFAVISGPVIGAIGDPVSANIEEIGLLTGSVSETFERAFCMRLDPEKTDSKVLARRIEWLRRHASNRADDQRAHRRFRPRNPHATLLLGDGTRLDCFLIDISSSGAALSTDLTPAVGEPMAIGTLVCRVVRIFETGFAVALTERVEPGELEKRLGIAHHESATGG